MSDPAAGPPKELLEVLSNLARSHSEHEKFYGRAPLSGAIEIEGASRALKALAARWSEADPSDHPVPSPLAGAEDLNAPGLVGESGILFMEGEGEPAEIARMKRDLAAIASDAEETGTWLGEAMGVSWQVVGSLVDYPQLADLLGQRHRIVANDWEAAGLSSLVGRLVKRALELLERVDFAPGALREDMRGARIAPAYLYSAAELLDSAAAMFARSATLIQENEPRWRAFLARVRGLQDA